MMIYEYVMSYNARVVDIKFKPKKRNQTVELTKWLGSKSNWLAPSLSQSLPKFIGSFFENLLISKEVSLVFAYITRNTHYH